MGHASQPEHGERAEPEDLRADRDLAEPADRRQPPVCVSRWFVVEAELGRRGAECIAAGGDWRKLRGISRSIGSGGRLERRQGEFDGVCGI